MRRRVGHVRFVAAVVAAIAVLAPAASADVVGQTDNSATTSQCGSPAFPDWTTRTGAIRAAATYPEFHAGHDKSWLRQDPNTFTRVENGAVTATSMQTIC